MYLDVCFLIAHPLCTVALGRVLTQALAIVEIALASGGGTIVNVVAAVASIVSTLLLHCK